MAKIRKTVTMADIAQRMDVSIVTVSKALSGQKGVSREVREKILELADELGYKSGKAETGEKKSYRIGILIPAGTQGMYDSFYWGMYQAVADKAMRQNCFTSYESLSEDMVEKNLLPKLIRENVVDGMIVIGRPSNGYGRFLKEKAGIPLAFLDFYEDFQDVDCFISDGFYGTYALTNYLFEKGHREIAYVGSLYMTESITDRYLGYLKSQMEHGVHPGEDYIIPDRSMNNGIMENFQSFDLPEKMPTAFVCNCDLTAGLLIRDLMKRGLRVPEDVSVVGFDNYQSSMFHEVDITTYAVDIEAMAGEAVRALVHRMAGEDRRTGIHIVEGYLVEKASVAKMEAKD